MEVVGSPKLVHKQPSRLYEPMPSLPWSCNAEMPSRQWPENSGYTQPRFQEAYPVSTNLRSLDRLSSGLSYSPHPLIGFDAVEVTAASQLA